MNNPVYAANFDFCLTTLKLLQQTSEVPVCIAETL